MTAIEDDAALTALRPYAGRMVRRWKFAETSGTTLADEFGSLISCDRH